MIRKRALYTSIGILLFSCVILLQHALPVFAEDSTPTPTPKSSGDTPTPTPDNSKEKIDEINDRIRQLEETISGLQEEEKTLSSQIDVMDNQIQLTEYRINVTHQEIGELNDDIGVATTKVSKLETSLDGITKILLNRIVATYEVGSAEPIHLLLSANNLSDFFTRANYLRAVQAHDKKLIFDTQQAKNDYQNQKTIFEVKKEKVEVLKGQLEEYTSQLDADKAEKEELLSVTQNDERKYQSLLASARAERNAIEGVVSSIKLVDGSPVTKGQTIAVVGNSGAPYCSTGPHLHFEVRSNGALVDPGGYLRSGVNFTYSYGSDQYGYYGSVNPTGSWDWPLAETIRVNQGYGSHGYARSFYPSGSHTGIDMVSLSSSLITSPADGTVYRGSTSCSGAAMNYVAVDHGGGIVSWYWHVQ